MSVELPRTVTVTARQGLALGGPAEIGADKTTLRYIPGSTLRGALAARWITEFGQPTRDNPRRAEFLVLFEGAIRFGPLLPDGSSVVPLSGVWCKYPAGDQCAGWSADLAVDHGGRVGVAAFVGRSCPHCGGGLAAGKGEIDHVATVRVVRTALDETGRAKDKTLRSRHELSAGQTFHGAVWGWHEWLGTITEVFLGGQRSVNGRAAISISDAPASADASSDGERDTAATVVVVRLTSPAILVDRYTRPSLDLRTEVCHKLGIADQAVDPALTRQWVRPVRSGGWHAASRLPKPVEFALSMGSTLRLVLRDGYRLEPEALKTLEYSGIGLRRTEGFGTVQLNPPPWHKAAPAARQAAPRSRLLELVRTQGLLDRRSTATWLLDRARQVYVERQRDPGYSFARVLEERVAYFFTDAQADAVSALFDSPRLAEALPLLERELTRLHAVPTGPLQNGVAGGGFA